MQTDVMICGRGSGKTVSEDKRRREANEKEDENRSNKDRC